MYHSLELNMKSLISLFIVLFYLTGCIPMHGNQRRPDSKKAAEEAPDKESRKISFGLTTEDVSASNITDLKVRLVCAEFDANHPDNEILSISNSGDLITVFGNSWTECKLQLITFKHNGELFEQTTPSFSDYSIGDQALFENSLGIQINMIVVSQLPSPLSSSEAATAVYNMGVVATEQVDVDLNIETQDVTVIIDEEPAPAYSATAKLIPLSPLTKGLKITVECSSPISGTTMGNSACEGEKLSDLRVYFDKSEGIAHTFKTLNELYSTEPIKSPENLENSSFMEKNQPTTNGGFYFVVPMSTYQISTPSDMIGKDFLVILRNLNGTSYRLFDLVSNPIAVP
jgi:hypothetical protein